MTDATPRVALLGCGAWGQNIARTLHGLNALHCVCDGDAAARVAADTKAPGVPWHADSGAAFHAQVDAIAIATPAETHYDLARAALLADKDVFVEKPMALHSHQAAELTSLAATRGRILMVGHVLEYHPAILKLRAMVDSGDLGRVHYLYSNRLNLGKIRREENALWSFAPHDIAVMLRIQRQMPIQVISLGGAYIQPNIADVTVTHLLFANGARAHIFVSWLHPFKEQRLVVVGSRNMVTFDDVSKTLVLYDRRVEVQGSMPVPITGAGQNISFAADEPLQLEMMAFLRAIQTRQTPLTDGESAVRTLQILQAAHTSLLSGGTAQSIQGP